MVLREIMERSGIVEWMTPQLSDPRRQEDVVHDLASLIRTSVLLTAQGWRDHDDADALRGDPALRLAASSASGRRPLDCVFLVTSLSPERMSRWEVLGHCRERDTAEGHMGELKDVLAPALSSTNRPKTHWRRRKPRSTSEAVDAFARHTRCGCSSRFWPTS